MFEAVGICMQNKYFKLFVGFYSGFKNMTGL